MHDIMKRMKTRREELNMSYQTLSEKVGISKSTLQRYETGYIRNMPVDKLEEIANALKFSPLYLMGWENKATNTSKDSNILNLYKNIRARRLELKMSQDSLAELTGYKDRSSIAKIEKGEVDLAESKIREFAKALNLSPQELMGWKEKENSQMSSVKERIFGAVTIMSEKDAEKIWELIQATFVLGNAEEVPAEPEEIEALDAYQNGNPEYQPRYTHEEMLRELGLEK